ncbi:MAG TPA: CBS domain-containing protein [Longimicrobiaceae bacterium]|nr:CBS domain-containing protein [Longimicrobiaceae bacterium]
MTIRDLLRAKGQHVVTLAPGATALDALHLLVQHNIGALVVLGPPDQRIRGIISERDLMRAAARDPEGFSSSPVERLMTADVVTATPDAAIASVMDTMTEGHFRHLPVVDGGGLCGIISIGDVVNAVRRSLEMENQHLHAYIAGVVG